MSVNDKISLSMASVDEFVQCLETELLGEVARKFIFSGSAHVFNGDGSQELALTQHLVEGLGVKPNDVCVVGSAKTGFSLSPDNFPRQFLPTSDIDVIVVSDEIFDGVWHSLLKWHYPFGGASCPKSHHQWIKSRKDDVYWGWFYPTRLTSSAPELHLPRISEIRDLSVRWFETLKSASVIPVLAGHEVKARLYRTWDHADRYHTHGLSIIKKQLRKAP